MSLTQVSKTVINDNTSSSFSFRNLIINGSMNVHQRAVSVSNITASSYNTADRWVLDIATGFGTWTQSVDSSDVPSGTGLRKSLRMLCTSNVPSPPTAGNFIKLRQTIEAQNCNILKIGTTNAESITVSFWVKSTVTGTYTVEIENQTSGSNRIVCGTYTVNNSNVWERKSITFPPDTIGSVNNDNGVGLLLAFYLGAGSNYTSGTLQTTWGATVNANRVSSSQANAASAVNNIWLITGIQFEIGTVATAFENLPYDVQLQRCYRYFVSYSVPQDYTDGYSGTILYRSYPLPVEMRTAPTGFEIVNPQFQYYSGGTGTNFTPTFSSAGRLAFTLFGTSLTSARGVVGGTVRVVAEL